MRKKILLVALMVALFAFVLAISASAGSLSNFINVDLTLNDGSQVEAYLAKGSTWSGYQGYSRVTIYADYTDTSKTIRWSNVKVFDGRNSTIHTYDGTTLTDTGAYAQTLLGYQTELSTVTHFYYPQGSLIVADNSFALYKGWNLEYLYIPRSVKILGTGICNSFMAGEKVEITLPDPLVSKLTTVEFESGSELQEIKGSAFRDCSALTSINLQDTKLKTISGADGNSKNGNVFKGCSSLTSIQLPETIEYIGYNAFYLTGLTGKMVLPNSVTHLGPGSFLATKIETLVIGDGPVTIGFNFVGGFSDNSISFENTYLKSVYIPSEATITEPSETWRKCANQVTFYVIEGCTTLINSLKASDNSTHMSIGMADDENAESYDGVIVEGYNVCEAFYKNEHIISNGACTRCEEKVFCSNPEHNLEIVSISYENGYDAKGKKIVRCLECNASETKVESPAIFTCLGYSTPMKDDDSLTLGFLVNNDALDAYTANTGKTVKFGMFATKYERIDGTILDENGNEKNGAIKAEINIKVTSFDFVLTGFETETHKTAKLALGAYVIATDAQGEGMVISYMQFNAPEEGYSYITYNDALVNNQQ